MCILDFWQGLVEAVHTEFPTATHRTCCHHLWKNFNSKFANAGLRNLFWDASGATNEAHFNRAMNMIREVNPDAHRWLTELDVHTWSLHAMDPSVKCEHITSNFVESFNAWLHDCKMKPYLSLFEHIRSQLMDMYYTRKAIAERCKTILTPEVISRISGIEKLSKHAEVWQYGNFKFE